MQRLCTRLSRKTGIHIHCHRFRHTFAVNMLRNGIDIRTLQKLMGHASVQILTRYLNLASADAVATHQNNSPADRFYAQRSAGSKRLPIRRHQNIDPQDTRPAYGVWRMAYEEYARTPKCTPHPTIRGSGPCIVVLVAETLRRYSRGYVASLGMGAITLAIPVSDP